MFAHTSIVRVRTRDDDCSNVGDGGCARGAGLRVRVRDDEPRVSGATVFHKVPASRMTTDYIAARSRDSRQSAALYGKSLNRDSLAAASIRQAQRIVREVGGSIVFSIKLARKLREPRERDK